MLVRMILLERLEIASLPTYFWLAR